MQFRYWLNYWLKWIAGWVVAWLAVGFMAGGYVGRVDDPLAWILVGAITGLMVLPMGFAFRGGRDDRSGR